MYIRKVSGFSSIIDTRHVTKTKDRAIRAPLTIGVELGCPGKVSSYNLATTPAISHE
jgi:hypothetical protein